MKLPREMKDLLDGSGFPWSVERGGSHLKIKVETQLVGILPHGNNADKGRAMQNVMAQIRRALRARAAR